MNVIHFHRRPAIGHYSIEGIFKSLREVMHENGLEVTPAVAPYCSKGVWPRVANILWAARNQAVVNHVTGDDHYLTLLMHRDRTVLTIHDCFAMERLHGLKRWLMRILWFEIPIRRSALITTVSEQAKRELLRHVRVDPKKIVVIPNPIASIFRPSPKAFNSECPRILHIGTKPNKNLPRLIKALTGIRCVLHVIGTVTDSQCRQLRASGLVYETEANLSDCEMYRAYTKADVVCLVSTYEGFGMPIIEGQWVERPVVTSNCSSMPEVAGGGACLVNPFNTNSIRAGILRVTSDASYRSLLIEQGRENRERFAIETIAGRYKSLYTHISTSVS